MKKHRPRLQIATILVLLLGVFCFQAMAWDDTPSFLRRGGNRPSQVRGSLPVQRPMTTYSQPAPAQAQNTKGGFLDEIQQSKTWKVLDGIHYYTIGAYHRLLRWYVRVAYYEKVIEPTERARPKIDPKKEFWPLLIKTLVILLIIPMAVLSIPMVIFFRKSYGWNTSLLFGFFAWMASAIICWCGESLLTTCIGGLILIVVACWARSKGHSRISFQLPQDSTSESDSSYDTSTCSTSSSDEDDGYSHFKDSKGQHYFGRGNTPDTLYRDTMGNHGTFDRQWDGSYKERYTGEEIKPE